MRRAAKVDDNQVEVVRKLRLLGASVTDLSAVGAGCPDLLVGYRGANYLLEVKRPDASLRRTIKDAGTKERAPRELTPDQARWHEGWRGQKAIVHDSNEALRAIGALK